MTGGAPHGPWPVQYECRCGMIIVPQSEPAYACEANKKRSGGGSIGRRAKPTDSE